MKIAVVADRELEKFPDVKMIEAPFSAEDILDFDIVIDFSSPDRVLDNIIMYCHLGLPAIIASSSWLDKKDFILSLCQDDIIKIGYGDFFLLSDSLLDKAKAFALSDSKEQFERII